MANILTVKGSAQRLSNQFEKARQQLRDNDLKRKRIIRDLAYSIEQQGLLPCGFICEEIVNALSGAVYGVGPQYIRRCLDKKYKRKYNKKIPEENAPGFVIHQKKVVEDRPNLLTTANERKLAIELYRTKIEKETAEEEWELSRQQNEHLRQENQEIQANEYRLKKHIRELQLQLTQPFHIKVPTKIWMQLQSMALSNVRDANIIVEQGAYVRLESESNNV